MGDTTSPHGELLLVILAGVAEFERSLILARTTEGRVRAKAAGVHMGRPAKLTWFQIAEAKRRLENGESQSEIARLFGVSHQTIGRL